MLDAVRDAGRGIQRIQFPLRRFQALARGRFQMRAVPGAGEFQPSVIEQRLDQLGSQFPLSPRNRSTCSRSQDSSRMP